MRRLFRRFYDRFVSLKGEPRKLALGFAIGFALGIFPIWGIHLPIAILIASTFRVHLSSMVVACWITGNPITFTSFFIAEFYLGKWLLDFNHLVMPQGKISVSTLLPLGLDMVSCVFLGFLILAIVVAILSYPVARLIFRRIARVRAMARS
jgi:uncharacterized protein (DUF2062 family)